MTSHLTQCFMLMCVEHMVSETAEIGSTMLLIRLLYLHIVQIRRQHGRIGAQCTHGHTGKLGLLHDRLLNGLLG